MGLGGADAVGWEWAKLHQPGIGGRPGGTFGVPYHTGEEEEEEDCFALFILFHSW